MLPLALENLWAQITAICALDLITKDTREPLQTAASIRKCAPELRLGQTF